MKKLVICFFSCILLLMPGLIQAQQNKIDSLQNLLKTSNDDTTKVNTLNDLCKQYINKGNYEAAMQYADQALFRAQKINFKKGIAYSFGNIGLIYKYQGNYGKALDSYFNSLTIREQIEDKRGLANTYNSIGLIYEYQGNYEKALDSHFKSLKIMEEIGNKKGVSFSYNNIGIVYEKQGNYEKALDNYFKSLTIKEEIGYKQGIASSYNNIGNIYYYLKNYDNALGNYEKSLKIEEEIGDKSGMADSYNNMGIIYLNQRNYQMALESHLKSLKIYEEIENQNGIASTYNNIGNIYEKQVNYEKALDNYLKGLKIYQEIGFKQGITASYINIGNIYLKQNKFGESYDYINRALIIYKEIGYKDGIKEAYFSLSELQNKKGDYKQAYKYHKLYSDIKDTLLNEQSAEQIAEMNTKYDSEKKDKELIKKDAEISKQQAETEKQNLQRNAFIIGFALVIVLAFFIFRGYRQKRNANKLLEEKNIFIENQKKLVENKNEIIEEKQREIIASITYAKRIQQAILPPDNLVREFLPDSFILYKPKDIVAGDFYWIETTLSPVGRDGDGCILIAAADCTGHGVPGAMVSVVCNNALNRSLREFGLRDPGYLLDKTRELVIEQFEKSEEEVKDGMDISLCSLNYKTNQLLWAGANNPLWIIHNNQLVEIKSNKQPIGKYIETKPFTTHTIQLQKGDTIYLFSDGYADQFGGEHGKKFKGSKMKELLLSVQNKTMDEQKELLNQAFEFWKGNLEQVDDVLIIGIRI